MEPNGVVDVVADIRQYWGWNHDNTDAELFANVQRQWESSRRSDDAAKDFVLQVLACGLEEQLLLWLLQPHPADAAEDIRILFTVCKDPYFTADGCELLKPMLDALLLAAAVRAAACDRNVKNRKQRMAGILEAMEGRMFSKTKSVLKAWHKSEISEEDVDSWTRFLELSNVLDPRQADLAIVRGSIDTVGLDGDNQIPTADMLWDLTTQIVGAGFEEYLKVKASVALPMEMQLNLLTLIQQLFQHVVQGNGGSVIDPAVMKSTFNLVFEALCSTNARDLRLAVLVRETLLLLLKNIMELMYDPASMISLDELTIPLNSSLWTLVSLFNSDLGNDELCKGLQDVAAVEAYMQEKSMGEASPLRL
ncbi:hypothetical protein JG688_00008000 [Phytophthora aleatoria]|uniref:Uncharacterized protein n=1 Tax=Phytophthora aleatoria TaxID=2496075 RepID=A0A8J5MFU3_9STRA|nr:hypothetical protein JG688_00008000 [Phytophthora aleatoria]